MVRTRFIRVVCLALSGLALIGTAWAQEKVVFMTGWVPQGKNAAFHVALEKGYYRDQGLAVEIQRGYGTPKTVQAVDLGQATFGEGDMIPIIVTRSKGGKIRAVGLFTDKAVAGLTGRKDTGIRSVKDLEGRSVGMSATSTMRQLLPVMAAVNGADVNKIRIVTISEAIQLQQMLNKQVDVASIWKTSGYEQAVLAAKKMGLELVWLGAADWGVDIYAQVITVSDRTLKERPDLVRRFLRATYQGFDFALKQPDEAVRIFVKHNPTWDFMQAKLQWDSLMESLDTPARRQHGLGYMAEDKMRRTLEIVTKAFKIQNPPALSEIYTNEFLPR